MEERLNHVKYLLENNSNLRVTMKNILKKSFKQSNILIHEEKSIDDLY
jgi:hypothetical protein